jgi:hypothetical protein
MQCSRYSRPETGAFNVVFMIFKAICADLNAPNVTCRITRATSLFFKIFEAQVHCKGNLNHIKLDPK